MEEVWAAGDAEEVLALGEVEEVRAAGEVEVVRASGDAEEGWVGMEGAREILKRHDFEGRSSKAEAANRSRSAAGGSGNTGGILDPVSIHPVPASQSGR